MIKYNVEIVLKQQEIAKKKNQLEAFDISLEEALAFVKRTVAQHQIIEARVIDETGRQIKLPNF